MAKPNFETQEHRLDASKAKEYVTESLVGALHLFADRFGEPQVIYYPSCSTDLTPLAAFPNSRVIFVDIDQKAIDYLKAKGLEAEATSAETYIPNTKVDLLFLLNPGIPPTRTSRQVRLGGFVFCNNWHMTANQMYDNHEFKLVAIAIDEKNNPVKLITDQEADEAWQAGMNRSQVDNGYIFQRIKENEQTDEEAMKEYEESEAEKRRKAEEYESQYRGNSINLDDI